MTAKEKLEELLTQAESLLVRLSRDVFAASKTGKAKAAVIKYQTTLEEDYEAWANDTAYQLAEADSDAERQELLAAALLILLALLKRHGKEALPEAVDLALDGDDPDEEIAALLASTISKNSNYLTESLIPDVKAKLSSGLTDPDIIAAIAGGTGAAAIGGLMATFIGRVGSYAGEFWRLYNETTGVAAGDGPVIAYLDPDAKHCHECPEFHSEGGKEYASFDAYKAATGGRVPGDFECLHNCRCFIERGGEIIAIGPGAI